MTGKHQLNPAHYSPEVMPHYDPLGVHPHIAPTAGIFDEPRVFTCINAQWLSHLTGMMERLTYLDSWQGTEDEKYAAIDKVVKIISEFDKAENMNCCCDEPKNVTNRRVNSDGSLEVSYDGGETWEPDPEDPRIQIPNIPPIVGDGSGRTKCDAATNGVEHMKDVQTGIAAKLGTGLGLFALAAAVIGLLVTAFFGPELLPIVTQTLIPIIIAVISGIASLTPTEYNAIFTNEVWDDTLCVLYCHIGSNGQFTQSGFESVVSDLQIKLPGGTSPIGAAQNVASFVKVWGLNGLNYHCSYGEAAVSDCSSCECVGCNIGDWDIFVNGEEVWGTIIDAGDDFITVQADLTASGYEAALVSSNYLTKCCKLSFEILDAVEGQAYYHLECGENPATVSPHMGLFPTACINFIQASHATEQFTIKYTFLADEC